MAADGTIYPLTVSADATPIRLHQLVMKGLSIRGSCVAARPAIRKMLSFAAVHGIKPVIMEWPMNETGIAEAMEALRTGNVRYRAVLTV
jgi:D-arabinose 1-dehydrogenase-like Zn-dependent alcohol dehydrogenase